MTLERGWAVADDKITKMNFYKYVNLETLINHYLLQNKAHFCFCFTELVNLSFHIL